MAKHSAVSAEIDNEPECTWIHMDHNSRCARQLQLPFSASFGVFGNSFVSDKSGDFSRVWFFFCLFRFDGLTLQK